MPRFHTKKSLYQSMDEARYEMGFHRPQDVFNAFDFCSQSPDFRVTELPIKTQGLQGILQIGEDFDIIILNKEQSITERNFYCGHELVHSREHRYENLPCFHCYESIRTNQNKFVEWQANEGSAQLIMPYQDFIPHCCFLIDQLFNGNDAVHMLADHYGVTATIVINRINTLSYKLDQYRDGCSIENLDILSKYRQDELGIQATPYPAILDFSIPWDGVIHSF